MNIELREKGINENLENEYIKKLELADKEWLEIFPEAKDDYIIPKITELNQSKVEIEEKIKKQSIAIRKKSKPENQWFWYMKLAFFEVQDLTNIERKISHFKHLLSLSEKDSLSKKLSQNRFKNLITENMIKEAENKPLEDIVGSIISLKKSNKDFVGLCPFHSEKTPSFRIYTNTNSFYCFGCQKGGNTINFVREYYNLSFREAIEFLT